MELIRWHPGAKAEVDRDIRIDEIQLPYQFYIHTFVKNINTGLSTYRGFHLAYSEYNFDQRNQKKPTYSPWVPNVNGTHDVCMGYQEFPHHMATKTHSDKKLFMLLSYNAWMGSVFNSNAGLYYGIGPFMKNPNDYYTHRHLDYYMDNLKKVTQDKMFTKGSDWFDIYPTKVNNQKTFLSKHLI